MSGKKEKAVAPKLRFPEFRDAGEWEVKPLVNLAAKRTERNLQGKISRVLTNSAEHGVLDQRDYFDKDIAVQGNLENYFVVDRGDFVYNPRISSFAPVGPISRNDVGKGVMSPLYTVFSFRQSDTGFFAHYFNSSVWHSYMRKVGSTGARHDRMAISNGDLLAMPLPVPNPKEQQKIANSLSSLDEVIELEARKLDALKIHKKGLMQQLFPAEGETTPRLRFPEFRDAGEWEVKRLGDGIQLVSGQHLGPNDYTNARSDYPYFTGPSDFTSNETDVKKWVASAIRPKLARHGDTLVTVKGSGVGELWLLKLSEVAMGRQLMAVRGVKFDSRFVFYLLDRKKSYLASLAIGNMIPGISREDLLSLSSVFPLDVEEQQKIANCLSSLDGLIDLQAQKVEALKQHKKGLMQQLFPSLDEVQG